MTTALEVLALELRLTALELRFVKALLDASPVSRAGQSALIPIQELCNVLDPESGADADAALRDDVSACLAGLLRSPRTLTPANGRSNLTLFVLARVELGNTTFFAQCQFDSRFLALLRSVADERRLDLY